MVPNTVTAEEILSAIRHCYSKAAIVSEVVVADEFEYANMRRFRAQQFASDSPRRLARMVGVDYDAVVGTGPDGTVTREDVVCHDSVHPVPDVLPDGWTMSDSKLIRRIDGLMLEGGKYTAIEIKVSRADFKRDTEEKRRMWRSITHRFIYAVPKGLIDPSEVPAYAGIWEYDPSDPFKPIKSVKRAATNKQCLPLPQQVVTAMFYRSARAEQTKTRRPRRSRRQ